MATIFHHTRTIIILIEIDFPYHSCRRVEMPLEMKRINHDKNIEICSISDDDEFALGLTNIQIKSEPSNSLQVDLGQQSILPVASAALAATPATPFTSTEAQDTSIQLQSQRPNKLLRSRAPVNQTKPKDDDLTLIETSLMILDESPMHSSRSIVHPSTSSSTAIAPILPQYTSSIGAAAIPSTSSGITHSNYQLLSFLPSTSSSILQPSTSKSVRNSKPIVQDGSATLTMVHPANGSVNSNANTEPELVLSPAKLGQWKRFQCRYNK